MVKLTWERKVPVNINFVENKKKYSNFFEDFINNISFGNEQVLFNSEFTGWKNKLFWGDNLEVLYSLLNNFSNKVDLIYVDPPFFSGVNYKIEILEDDIVYDSIAYVDCWQNNLDSYLQMLYERIQLFKKLLSLRGLLFVHLDWHASHYIKILLDEVFGENRYVNNIIWYYYNKYSAGK
ncbi:MAG: DNA methyltransferase, partial [Candidatus Thorarchaeota archaeon]